MKIKKSYWKQLFVIGFVISAILFFCEKWLNPPVEGEELKWSLITPAMTFASFSFIGLTFYLRSFFEKKSFIFNLLSVGSIFFGYPLLCWVSQGFSHIFLIVVKEIIILITTFFQNGEIKECIENVFYSILGEIQEIGNVIFSVFQGKKISFGFDLPFTLLMLFFVLLVCLLVWSLGTLLRDNINTKKVKA